MTMVEYTYVANGKLSFVKGVVCRSIHDDNGMKGNLYVGLLVSNIRRWNPGST